VASVVVTTNPNCAHKVGNNFPVSSLSVVFSIIEKFSVSYVSTIIYFVIFYIVKKTLKCRPAFRANK
jgi:hypothetical protein